MMKNAESKPTPGPWNPDCRENVKVRYQGKAHVQHNVGTEYIVCLPDGTIKIVDTYGEDHWFEPIREMCKKWFRDHCEPDAIAVGEIVFDTGGVCAVAESPRNSKSIAKAKGAQ